MPPVAPTSDCVVLVPVGGAVESGCEDALRELERRGHPVWRYRGYSAVDAARNQMATDAVERGFAETFWVDSDVVFDPDDVQKLREHGLPFTCGLYAKKGPRQLACEFLPGTPAVRFGKHGGPVEVRYCGFGFAHVRREVFLTVQRELRLPVCNRRFGSPLVPFFQPAVVTEPTGPWSLSEDYAFCERARRCGFKVVADTSVRLWHVGSYRYGWEDAGGEKERFADYTFRLPGAPPGDPLPHAPPPPLPPGEGFTRDWFSYNVPLWEKLLAPLVGRPVRALEVGVFEGRSTVWLLENVLTHPDATLAWVDTFAGGAEHDASEVAGLEAKFRANTAPFAAKLDGHVGRSQDVLRGMSGEQFDLVYIDGSHEAADVLADAVLAWPLVKAGGLVGFDDYEWRAFPEAHRRPGPAIDAFLAAMRGRFEELHRGYQLWVRKTR
jgi:predicted O-methyltransferase YrrM